MLKHIFVLDNNVFLLYFVFILEIKNFNSYRDLVQSFVVPEYIIDIKK